MPQVGPLLKHIPKGSFLKRKLGPLSKEGREDQVDNVYRSQTGDTVSALCPHVSQQRMVHTQSCGDPKSKRACKAESQGQTLIRAPDRGGTEEK